MTTHHCTCQECERRRQQLGDEAFADMVVMAHWHPEWFTFGDTHVHHHDDDHREVLDDDVDHQADNVDNMDGFDQWD